MFLPHYTHTDSRRERPHFDRRTNAGFEFFDLGLVSHGAQFLRQLIGALHTLKLRTLFFEQRYRRALTLAPGEQPSRAIVTQRLRSWGSFCRRLLGRLGLCDFSAS